MSTLYCIDACSLIWAMKFAYPIEHFPALWGKMSEASKSGLIISTELVFDELNTQVDNFNRGSCTIYPLGSGGVYAGGHSKYSNRHSYCISLLWHIVF